MTCLWPVMYCSSPVPCMFWNCTMIRRAFAHSPSSLNRMSPTMVLNVFLWMYSASLSSLRPAGRLDRLLQHLHGGVGEGRLIEAERIDAGVLRLRLILLQEVLDAGKVHLRARNEEMVVHDAIELFGKLRDQRGVLHAHHRAAEQLGLAARSRSRRAPSRPNPADRRRAARRRDWSPGWRARSACSRRSAGG